MVENNTYRKETFRAWAELVFLLDMANLLYQNQQLRTITEIHKKKFASQKVLQQFKDEIKLNDINVFMISHIVSKEVLHKWYECISLSYKFLQYARTRGGTYGYKVGCLYAFLINNLEENKEFIISYNDDNL